MEGQSTQDLWHQFSGQSIYSFIWEMFGYCQKTQNIRMSATLDESNTLTEINEKTARDKYSKDTEDANKAFTKKVNGQVEGISTGGIVSIILAVVAVVAIVVVALAAVAAISFFTCGVGTIPAIGIAMGSVMTAALPAVLIAAAMVGAPMLLAKTVYTACNEGNIPLGGGFSEEVHSMKRPWYNSNQFWAGGTGSLDSNGNSKDSFNLFGWVKLGQTTQSDDKAKRDASHSQDLAKEDYLDIQDAQRQIQNVMTQYSQEQTQKTTEMDNFQQALKYFAQQIQSWR